MAGETNLSKLIKEMTPILNPGEWVFTRVKETSGFDGTEALATFREKEGITLVLERQKADSLQLAYDFVASWITLSVHSSLEAVGLTALFSSELAKHGISCNVMAGYYHDHIFVHQKDGARAMQVLQALQGTLPK